MTHMQGVRLRGRQTSAWKISIILPFQRHYDGEAELSCTCMEIASLIRSFCLLYLCLRKNRDNAQREYLSIMQS